MLSEQEISNLLYAQEVDKDDFVALRNQLILEMFYETGMRRSELVGLLEGGVDLSSRVLRVFGKGRKERIIPFGDRLAARISEYLALKHQKVGLSQIFCFFG